MFNLNSIALSTYSIVASQAPGSNIAVTGIFDLPKRIGQIYQEWAEDDGVEPFVGDDEIFTGGRDIVFYGLILGSRTEIQAKLDIFKDAIALFTDLVEFETDYGTYNVKLDSGSLKLLDEIGTISIKMREPQPDLSGGSLPSIAENGYKIDNIPMSEFGLYVSTILGRENLAGLKTENFTIWDAEGYQVTGRHAEVITINGIIQAATLNAFQDNIKALWKIFTDSGLRKIILNDYVTVESFIINGFSVRNIIRQSGLLLGEIKVEIVKTASYIQVYVEKDSNEKILTTEDGKILVYG